MRLSGLTAPCSGMRRPGHNHCDRRLACQPRDYFANPPGFGSGSAGSLVMPAGGDPVSGRVALAQHRLVRAWLAGSVRGDGARVAARFGMSPSTWSRIIGGHRWAGSLGMAALVTGAGERSAPEDGNGERP